MKGSAQFAMHALFTTSSTRGFLPNRRATSINEFLEMTQHHIRPEVGYARGDPIGGLNDRDAAFGRTVLLFAGNRWAAQPFDERRSETTGHDPEAHLDFAFTSNHLTDATPGIRCEDLVARLQRRPWDPDDRVIDEGISVDRPDIR